MNNSGISNHFAMPTSLQPAKDELLIGRFAPSPTGRFHVGNIFSSLIATLVADKMVLRIEDLDPERSKQEYIDSVMRDLDWFGFSWEDPVVYQSSTSCQEAYAKAIETLNSQGLTYPCFCSRADLHSASAPHIGEEFIYQNTCKYLSEQQRKNCEKTRNASLRVDVSKRFTNQSFTDIFQGKQFFNLALTSGDFIIRRSDGIFAYQLAVVISDAYQSVTSVVRGVDLLTSTPKQQLLQQLLGYSQPEYGHVPIIVDELGRKLSKRNGNASLEYLIDTLGMSKEQIIGYLAYLSEIIPEYEPMNIDQLKHYANLEALVGKTSINWIAPK